MGANKGCEAALAVVPHIDLMFAAKAGVETINQGRKAAAVGSIELSVATSNAREGFLGFLFSCNMYPLGCTYRTSRTPAIHHTQQRKNQLLT